MESQQSALRACFKDFTEESLKGSGIAANIIEVRNRYNIFAQFAVAVFRARIGNHSSYGENSEKRKLHCGDESCSHSMDGFVSVMFNYPANQTLQNYCQTLTCLVSVIDVSGEKRFTQSFSANLHYMTADTHDDSLSIGIDEYMKCRTLLERKEEFLPGDTLTLQCDMTLDSYLKVGNEFHADSVVKDWCKFSRSVESILYNAGYIALEFKKHDISDTPSSVELKIWRKLGYEISTDDISVVKSVHSEIDLTPWKEKLCSVSPYFEGLFSTGMAESTTGIISVPADEVDHFESMMFSVMNDTIKHVAYTDGCLPLYIIADKYLLDSVKRMCVRCMMDDIQVKNAILIFLLARKYQEYTLEQSSVHFILSNWTNVVRTYNWKRLKESEPNLHDELIRLHEKGRSKSTDVNQETISDQQVELDTEYFDFYK